MISHRNVVHHCGYLRRCCEYTPESISVTWLPYFHDYGLIEGLLEPIYNGTPGYVMSPFSFLKRPFNWLQAISLLRATHTQAPNFAYEQCVRRIKPEQVAQLDLELPALRGQRRRADQSPGPGGVLPDLRPLRVPVGGLLPGVRAGRDDAHGLVLLAVARPPGRPLPGRCAGRESRRRDDATTTSRRGRSRAAAGSSASSTWPSSIPRPRPAAPPTRSARSGSPTRAWRGATGGATTRPRPRFAPSWPTRGKGRSCAPATSGFIRDGELYVTSRIKDLIIVAGANHYPQDIEWTVETMPPGRAAQRCRGLLDPGRRRGAAGGRRRDRAGLDRAARRHREAPRRDQAGRSPRSTRCPSTRCCCWPAGACRRRPAARSSATGAGGCSRRTAPTCWRAGSPAPTRLATARTIRLTPTPEEPDIHHETDPRTP